MKKPVTGYWLSLSLNYSLGVLSDTLFYNSYKYHNFCIAGATTAPVLSISATDTILTNNLTTTGNITFNNSNAIYKNINNIFKLTFDNNYGTPIDPLRKLILYTGTSTSLNFSLGVIPYTLFYNSPTYHNFYINLK